jgi:DNA-binding LacI/PurR family transcriptional regulator
MSRRVTRLEDLAARAGVSIATVSRALSDSASVNARTKQRIWAIAREQNYPFRRHAADGPVAAEATLALVLPRSRVGVDGLSDPFLQALIGGIGDAAREQRCDIVIHHATPTGLDDLAALGAAHRADGVIFLGQGGLHDQFNRLAERETRFVVWGANLPDQAYCAIGSDNLLGGRRATMHLARAGWRDILFLGDTTDPEATQRYRGHIDALGSAGLTADPERLIRCAYTVDAGREAVAALLDRGARFDAIVAASDLIAIGAIKALHAAGRSVPGDVAVTGYDDLALSRHLSPALTTIAQDSARAGRLLVSRLLEAAPEASIRSERLPTELVVRDSCGAATR